MYLGSGFGLTIYRLASRSRWERLPRSEARWFAGSIISGGVIAPVLLMAGLTDASATSASLLLNAEGVFTALLAWWAFGENFDRRIVLGMAFIVAGAVILSWPAHLYLADLWPSASILGACLAWGIDNNLTRKVSLSDATWIASIKGLTSGLVNTGLAVTFGAAIPSVSTVAASALVGFIAYGVSLALFVFALRELGTARTGAYFSVAPFFGALLAIAMGEPVTAALVVAASLMIAGVLLHLAERHDHPHTHAELEHDHSHVHDSHHQHSHSEPVSPGVRHRHWHRHLPISHSHAHFPDAHHRHSHGTISTGVDD